MTRWEDEQAVIPTFPPMPRAPLSRLYEDVKETRQLGEKDRDVTIRSIDERRERDARRLVEEPMWKL